MRTAAFGKVGHEPTAKVFKSCRTRSQNEIRWVCPIFCAASQRENRSLMLVAAKMARAIHRSRGEAELRLTLAEILIQHCIDMYNYLQYHWLIRRGNDLNIVRLAMKKILVQISSVLTILVLLGADEAKSQGRFPPEQENRMRLVLFAGTGDPQSLHEVMIQTGFNPRVGLGPEAKTTLVHVAAKNHEHPDTLRFLIDLGLDVNTINNRGNSPLAGAIYAGSPDTIMILLQAGASVRANAGPLNQTIVEFCKTLGQIETSKMMDENCAFLLRILKDIEIEEAEVSNYKRCLKGYPKRRSHCPCVYQYEDSALDTCAPVLSKDNFRLIARAASRGDVVDLQAALAEVDFLENEDITQTLDGTGTTLIHLAASNSKHPEVISYLAKNGADLNTLDYHGRTPLMAAIGGSYVETVKALLEAGANPLAAEGNGQSTLESCEKILERSNSASCRACLTRCKRSHRVGLDLSRFDAAPLIAFIATKETDYGTETNGRIPS